MGTNSIIILGGVVVLLLVGLAWVADHVRRQIKQLREIEKAVSTQLEYRRDTLPYLIESYRTVVEHPSDRIQAIIAKRAEAREAREFLNQWEKEEELEALLNGLFEETQENQALASDIGWLEARTEIQKAWSEINEKEEHYTSLQHHLQQKLKKFPFILFKGMKS